MYGTFHISKLSLRAGDELMAVFVDLQYKAYIGILSLFISFR
jgi:hypothetical protein